MRILAGKFYKQLEQYRYRQGLNTLGTQDVYEEYKTSKSSGNNMKGRSSTFFKENVPRDMDLTLVWRELYYVFKGGI